MIPEVLPFFWIMKQKDGKGHVYIPQKDVMRILGDFLIYKFYFHLFVWI